MKQKFKNERHQINNENYTRQNEKWNYLNLILKRFSNLEIFGFLSSSRRLMCFLMLVSSRSLCDILRPCELVASSFELYFNIPGLILLELSFITASHPVQIRLAHLASIQSGERAMVLADIVELVTYLIDHCGYWFTLVEQMQEFIRDNKICQLNVFYFEAWIIFGLTVEAYQLRLRFFCDAIISQIEGLPTFLWAVVLKGVMFEFSWSQVWHSEDSAIQEKASDLRCSKTFEGKLRSPKSQSC